MPRLLRAMMRVITNFTADVMRAGCRVSDVSMT